MCFNLFDKKITTSHRDSSSRVRRKGHPLARVMVDTIPRQFTGDMLDPSTMVASTHPIIMVRASSIIRAHIMLITAITVATIVISPRLQNYIFDIGAGPPSSSPTLNIPPLTELGMLGRKEFYK